MRKACLNALICCAAFLTAVPHFTAASQLRIVIAGEENVFPYSFTEDGRMKGMDYDIVVEAYRRMDIQAAVQFLPWNRMVHYVQDGNADAGFGLFYKKERESFALYPEVPLHYSRYSIFVKKGNEFRFESLPDLYGKRVGFIRGYKVNDAFDRAVAEGKILVEEVNEHALFAKMIEAGRFDCALANHDFMLYTLAQLGLSGKIVALPTPLEAQKPVYLVFSKTAKNITDKEKFLIRFNAVLAQMMQDGTFRKIRGKYLDR